MTTEFLGTGFPLTMDHYAREEHESWDNVRQQIDRAFPNDRNLLISLTWFGPQFMTIDGAPSGWARVLDMEAECITFDNVFLLATVDPPYINDAEQRMVKNKLKALRLYKLGNFDTNYQFNFFAPIIAENFKQYTQEELLLTDIKHIYVNYNRKPKVHRLAFVRKLMEHNLMQYGTVTLGRDVQHIFDQDPNNDLYLSIGENPDNYQTPEDGSYAVPNDCFTLHRMDVWQSTFLYVNAATEFNSRDDLFCQQDVFKPLLGLRPFVINGQQRTYRYLRNNGFRTFNHYWPHVNIENGTVHESIIELIKHLVAQGTDELQAMYRDMLPDLLYNQQRFPEYAREQKYKLDHLFE